VQGGRGTGYCGREGVFVMFASSKRGLVSLISCSKISSFFLAECLYVKSPPINKDKENKENKEQ
jgi:hypothetical protein